MRKPRIVLTDTQRERRVGIEIELSGLSGQALAQQITEHYPGHIYRDEEYVYRVDTGAGEFRIELDSTLIRELTREESGVELVAKVAEWFVPFEIVSPPLSMNRLTRFERLVRACGEAGARGTSKSAFYAFGVHLNPELPSLDVDTVQRYLKAFVCSYEWLEQAERPDWTRRLSRYIAPFDRAYVLEVLNAEYASMTELIDAYLKHNPSRNRALDMLPLFSHIDTDRVRAAVGDELIKSRPTLHYRLPNSSLSDPNWSLARPWNRWVLVDDLANDEHELSQLVSAYRAYLERDWTLASAKALQSVRERAIAMQESSS